MAILVTGGAGYIGSHTILALLEQKDEHEVVVLDDLSNSSKESLDRISKLTKKKIHFYLGSVLNKELLSNILSMHKIESVIHFAGLKSVGESVKDPVKYYYTNIAGTLVLLEAMLHYNVRTLVFSSSATVYGEPEFIPLTEAARVGGTTNPYGTSKLMVERILQDFSLANPDFSITCLRYFNPIGAHSSGLIGESPNGIPNNIFPYICQVAIGNIDHLSIFGNDYPTKDGTGIRDYIHVMDLAEGHLAALSRSNLNDSFEVYNIGTGVGYSVLELINSFKKMTGININYKFVERRKGDIAECWSDPSLAAQKLGWHAKRNIEDMICDAWRWQKNNPNGYR